MSATSSNKGLQWAFIMAKAHDICFSRMNRNRNLGLLDDIYISSKTIEEHENVLEYIYKCLYNTELYISPKKFKLYAIRFNCLGHYCDKHRLQASTNKLEIIHKWPTPSSYHDVQRFLGLVEYIS
jgi:hypothetical protein